MIDVELPVRIRVGLETGFDQMWTADPDPDNVTLELARPLPDVCVRHGRPATDRAEIVTVFRKTSRGREQDSFGLFFRILPKRAIGTPYLPAINTTLHGDWPQCERCTRRSKIFMWACAILALAGIPIAAAAFISTQLGAVKLPQILWLTLIPGWLPCLLGVAVICFEAGKRKARFRPLPESIGDGSVVIIRAHQDFAAAVAAAGT